MASRRSGSHRNLELLVVETADVTVILKGKLNTSKYVSATGFIPMRFFIDDSAARVQIYDTNNELLVDYDEAMELPPIFFENGNYEIIIMPETDKELSFYHEYELFRQAVSKVMRTGILMGNLQFCNEVGLSTLEIHHQQKKLLSFTIEVFPTKLDYQKDYIALIDDINKEIYNLSYSFIKRTHLQANVKTYKDPSLTEFYRLIQEHFETYMKAIRNVERMLHHQLITHYEEVRGECLGKQDSKGRAYLRKNAKKFVDVANGLRFQDRVVMPEKGLLIKKQHNVDTHENRYVKWTMERISASIRNLLDIVLKSCETRKVKPDKHLVDLLTSMIDSLQVNLKQPLWRKIGKLDRSVNSLVLQMAAGYREVFQIYTMVSQSLILYGEIYKMSLKDIATLYEYWTFLKLGQILEQKCHPLNQDIVQVRNSGIFVNLQQDQKATRTYVHPITGEDITLNYQYSTGRKVPTVQQRPDFMLSIGKVGESCKFQCVFDAKYRIDMESNPTPGPQREDINTMHRYRDAIVVERNGTYEQTIFGAYVLFPWNEQNEYKEHPLYKSIENVNIGGLPFLPNTTDLVEQFIENLLNKKVDELQKEGIVPRGTIEHL
ncbi:restriction endonuclease-like protein [Bacillus cereus]|uniref:restriction endonuclease-like protein n=1 Tax=Bacillus cereus TaxID=1396 RepID=UPI0006A8A4CD|nr:restriction endonuclease-like protein [Bacillus cereus]CUB29336.1 hypothetical protein BN2127_JRS4_00573 [Bacillus cereus]